MLSISPLPASTQREKLLHVDLYDSLACASLWATGWSTTTAQARRTERQETVAPGFPGDQAEAAGSSAAVGSCGMEKLGVEPEEEGGGDEGDTKAWPMELADVGAAASSQGAPQPEEPAASLGVNKKGGAGGRSGRRPLWRDRPRPARPL